MGRLCVPVAEWPEAWRLPWEAALAPSDNPFDEGGAAARLRPATIKMRAEAVGLVIAFLQSLDPSQEICSPAEFLTEQQIQGFVDGQRSRGVCNATLVIRLRALALGLKMMQPGLDVSLLEKPGGRSLKQALPATRRPVEIRDHRDIMAKVLALHAEGMQGGSYAHGHTALRDAALLGMIFWIGTRLRTLTRMEIGRSIAFRGNRYWVRFAELDTKTERDYELPLPAILNPVFDAYLKIARPVLGGTKTTALWVSTRGTPMRPNSITHVCKMRTQAWTGTGHGTHWARKCITTTVRMVAPELALDVATVLDHSMAVAQKHYDLGTAVSAAERHQKRVRERAKSTAARAEAAFRRSIPKDELSRFPAAPSARQSCRHVS